MSNKGETEIVINHPMTLVRENFSLLIAKEVAEVANILGLDGQRIVSVEEVAYIGPALKFKVTYEAI